MDVRIGAKQVKGLEIIAYDASSETYRTHAFDSQGNYGTYQARVHGAAWTFMGKSERATVVPSDAGNAMTIQWERNGRFELAPLDGHDVDKDDLTSA